MKQNDLKQSSQQDTFQSETNNEGSNIKLQRRMGEKPTAQSQGLHLLSALFRAAKSH